MRTSPDFLRGEAVAQIVGIMHQGHVAGPWSLMSVDTTDGVSTLTFAVGSIYPEANGDERQRVEIQIREL